MDRIQEKRTWAAAASMLKRVVSIGGPDVSPPLSDEETLFITDEVIPKIQKGYRWQLKPRTSALAVATSPEQKTDRDFQDGALWAMDQIKSTITTRRESLAKAKQGLSNDLSGVLSSIQNLLEGLWLDTSQAITTRLLAALRARKVD